MKKRMLLFVLAFCSCMFFAVPSSADTQALGTCLIDSLTGKERKQLAKWIFFAIAAHPEMSSFTNITVEERLNTDRMVGQLVTRLLVDDCAEETKAAQKANPLAIQQAFQLVGQVAMQELMTNEDVRTAISSYASYADQSKINSLFIER